MPIEANAYSQEEFLFAIQFFEERGWDWRPVIEFYVWCNLRKPDLHRKEQRNDLHALPAT